jgi:LysM repeat protein
VNEPGSVWTSTYTYDGNGRLTSVGIADGRPRTVSFINDANGQVMQRDEADSLSGGDPRELHYYFGGIAVGDVGNNGTSDVDYVTSIADHRAVPGWGPFQYGTTTGTAYADFDQAYDPINGLTYDSTSSHYTVNDGDTLQSIAASVWGDASYWYLIVDANGLTGSETLVAGQDLLIPNKVHNSHNSSDVYKVYDPNAGPPADGDADRRVTVIQANSQIENLSPNIRVVRVLSQTNEVSATVAR